MSKELYTGSPGGLGSLEDVLDHQTAVDFFNFLLLESKLSSVPQCPELSIILSLCVCLSPENI